MRSKHILNKHNKNTNLDLRKQNKKTKITNPENKNTKLNIDQFVNLFFFFSFWDKIELPTSIFIYKAFRVICKNKFKKNTKSYEEGQKVFKMFRFMEKESACTT